MNYYRYLHHLNYIFDNQNFFVYLLYKENLDYLRHIKYLLNILDENELKLYELHYLVKYY